jgi:hypothetical protein
MHSLAHVLAGADANNSPRKLQAFVLLLSRMHSSQRKLLRTQHARVSHFLTLTKTIKTTRSMLLEDATGYSLDLKELDHTAKSCSVRLKSLELKARQLREAHAAITAQLADLSVKAKAVKVC